MSLNAYQKTQSVGRSPRSTEYQLFGKVTHALINAKDKDRRDQEFIKALDWNRRMWSVLSADCATAGNGLPDQLRAQIVSLALFISRYTSQVMRGKEDLDTLIDINRTVMEGLAPQAKPAAPAAPPTAPVGGIVQDV